MGIREIFSLISILLKCPNIVVRFLKLLKKTPEQNHEELLGRIADETNKFNSTGRPTW